MAGDLRVLSRSLKHYKPTTSILPENSLSLQSNQWIHQTRRTLILELAPSHSVTFDRLSESYSKIIEVRFERLEVRNATGIDMQRRLQSAFEAVSEDSSANVLLIRNNVSKVFCAGADLKYERSPLSQMSSQAVAFMARYSASTLERAITCYAVMGLPETGLAIIPGAGGTQRLPRLVRKAISEELIFTGRKIGGREAMSIDILYVTTGLVNYCVPAGEAHLKAIEVARNINEKGVEVDKTSALALEEQCYEQTLNTNDAWKP
ncbi:unnamed protein product [Malus baccata var. baccata]